MMVSSTRFLKKHLLDWPAGQLAHAWAWAGVLLVCACVLMGLAAPAFAAAAEQPEILQMQIERQEDGLYMQTTVQFDLPRNVEDALNKGITMYFVAESEVLKERWYWADQKVASSNKYMRLSYQPLTHRWRLSISSAPFTGGGSGGLLGQNFDELDDALAAMQRISRWKIADSRALNGGGTYTVNFSFRLDISQLPRPFQIGAMGRSEWELQVARSQRLIEATP